MGIQHLEKKQSVNVPLVKTDGLYSNTTMVYSLVNFVIG